MNLVKSVLILVLVFSIFSCTENETEFSDDAKVKTSVLLKEIDSSSVVKFTDSKKIIEFNIGLSSSFPDSPDAIKLLRDYLLGNLFVLEDKKIPKDVKMNFIFSDSVKYEFFGDKKFQYSLFSDVSSLNYYKFLLKEVKISEVDFKIQHVIHFSKIG